MSVEGACCWGSPDESGCLLSYHQLISGCRGVRYPLTTDALSLSHDVRSLLPRKEFSAWPPWEEHPPPPRFAQAHVAVDLQAGGAAGDVSGGLPVITAVFRAESPDKALPAVALHADNHEEDVLSNTRDEQHASIGKESCRQLRSRVSGRERKRLFIARSLLD